MPPDSLPGLPHRARAFTLILSSLCICSQAFSQSSGDTLRTAAQVRSTLQTERAKIAAHPKDAALYIDLAYTLMDAGVADEAIEQGRMATQVDPRSSFAFNAYAWLLHHNAVGVDYGKGYNYEASLAAYRHAVELNPDDLAIRQSLSDILRYDPDGLEYSPKARLDLSIEALRYIQTHQRPITQDVINNLAVDLFRANRYSEVIQESDRYARTSSPMLDGSYLAATAITQSPTVALALADKLTDDRKRRAEALDVAAEALWTVRRYPQSAALLEANQEEHRGDDTTLRKIQLFRTLQPYSSTGNSGSDPIAVVRELIVAALDGTLSEATLNQFVAYHAYLTDGARQINASDLQTLVGLRQILTQQTGLPPTVVIDIAMSYLRLTKEPDAAKGQAKVDVQILGSTMRFFLTEENQRYRIVATSGEFTPIGEEALYLVTQDKLNEAAALLNWKREFSQVSPDDPLGGVLFAHLWSAGQTPGQIPDAESIRIAAASLTMQSPSSAALLPDLIAARDKATGTRQDLLTLLIASIELAQKDGVRASAEAKVLLTRYPDSLTALHLSGQGFRLTHNWPEWQAILASRLAAKPQNPDLLREQATEQLAQGEYAEARQTYRTLLDGGRATPADENEYAWISLFAGNVDAEAISAAESATAGKTPAPEALQTLACLYAVQGRAADAHDTLLRSMTAAHRVEPDDGIWLGLGLLYEQYGETQAAITAYRHVSEPKDPSQTEGSYVLAQLHLKHLAQSGKS